MFTFLLTVPKSGNINHENSYSLAALMLEVKEKWAHNRDPERQTRQFSGAEMLPRGGHQQGEVPGEGAVSSRGPGEGVDCLE